MTAIKTVVVTPILSKTNRLPYFSITATVYYVGGGSSRSGQCHDAIEEFYPNQYSDFIRLHLSDINGVPMYAVENGYYFLQFARGELVSKDDPYTYENVAKLLRIPDATILADFSKDEFIAFVEAQKPRWKEEANAVIEKYNLTVIS